MKNLIKLSLVGFLSGIGGTYTYHNFIEGKSHTAFNYELAHSHENLPHQVREVKNFETPARHLDMRVDFVDASSKSTPSVVYIKTLSNTDYGRGSWFDFFFENRGIQSVSSGSGVIYSADGYIITNNHVIENAEKIEIIHNKRTYEAEVVGIDLSTDLAVLKVDAQSLPNIKLGSSKTLAVGEWVLAVGNPFNLTSTVTAGIVSAKGREINIMKTNFPIESFIQTDAAINPGNSGGALVNKYGELVGINTAILSKTGSYAGYGFAVPSDIVRKVVDDLIKYGEVQKAFIGGDVIDMDTELAKKLNVTDLSGVVLSYIQKDGAAEKAGLQKGDIILKVADELINSRSAFEEQLSYYTPGDKVKVMYRRDNKIYEKTLTLTNKEGTTGIYKKEVFLSKTLGADFETVPKVERDLLNIQSGVRVAKVRDGFFKRLGIQEGFIITAINNNPTNDPKALSEIIEKIRGKVVIEGVNKKGVKGYYSYYF
jgi:serine protease Do